MSKKSINGLYAITPDEIDTEKLLIQVEAALQGGTRLLQYRNKLANSRLRISQAQVLLPLCRQYGALLIINDDIKLCLAIDADGLHLGKTDGNLAATRDRLGPHKLLGASCYNQYQYAVEAKAHGADYVAFGACFASVTKPEALPASHALFGQARDTLDLPAVAIGGITLDNARLVIEAGADAVAVIGALWNSADIQKTAQQFNQLFDRSPS